MFYGQLNQVLRYDLWMADGFFPAFFQSLHINEPSRLIWQAWQAHLGAENIISFKL